MSEGNGKWSLAFWVISVVAGAWLLALTQQVVIVDRLRASEDIRIQTFFASKLDLIQNDLTEIKVAVGRLTK